MSQLSEAGRRRVEEIAARHGVSADAALTLLAAVVAGHGNQAQFNHPELGGLGQWSRGGMVMVGDMFNNALKARVDALCTELSDLIGQSGMLGTPAQSQSQGVGSASLFVPGSSLSWWPAELGVPAAVGAQNDLRYAYFPASQRLAVSRAGRLSVHDTGEHQIHGVGQQQGPDQSITFTSQLGVVRVEDLPLVETDAPKGGGQAPGAPETGAGAATVSAPPRQAGEEDVFGKIERLSELHRKGILTDAEYEAKKAELLARL
jgi:hypothetical protein